MRAQPMVLHGNGNNGNGNGNGGGLRENSEQARGGHSSEFLEIPGWAFI